MSNTDFFDYEVERKFLGGLINNFKYFEHLSFNFNPINLGSPENNTLYNILLEFYRKNLIIGKRALLRYLEIRCYSNSTKTNEQRKRKYIKYYRKLEKLGQKIKYSEIVAFKEQVTQNAIARRILVAAENSLESLKVRNVEQAQRAIIDCAALSHTEEFRIYSGNFLETFENHFDKQKDFANDKDKIRRTIVPTGIQELDNVIMGLGCAEFGLVTGNTKTGKSIFLMNVACHAYKKHHNIAYVTIEMPKEQIESRMWSYFTGIEYKKFKKYQLDEHDFRRWERKALHLKKKYDNIFHIIDIPKGCTPLLIQSEIEKLARKVDIGLIVIDYMNIINTNDGRAAVYDWGAQVEVSQEIKSLARYFNKPVWSAGQLQGSKANKEGDYTQGDIAFAKDIANNIDIGLWIARPKGGGAIGNLLMGFMVARDYDCVGVHQVSINLDKMRMGIAARRKEE